MWNNQFWKYSAFWRGLSSSSLLDHCLIGSSAEREIPKRDYNIIIIRIVYTDARRRRLVGCRLVFIIFSSLNPPPPHLLLKQLSLAIPRFFCPRFKFNGSICRFIWCAPCTRHTTTRSDRVHVCACVCLRISCPAVSPSPSKRSRT